MGGITCIDYGPETGRTEFGETHVALFYRGAEDYAEGVCRFVEPALNAGDPVAIAVPGQRAGLLQERLAERADPIEFLDMVELGRNPARIIPAVEAMLSRSRGRALHYVGEPIWRGRSDAEVREATKHEALINLAWPGARIRVLCPYDAEGLSDGVLGDAQRTHPCLIRGREMTTSPLYHGPTLPVGCDDALQAPPPGAARLQFGLEDLFRVRALVCARAVGVGLDGERTSDLVLAVNELATNAIRHGHGRGTLHIWPLPGELVCQITDSGHITDPLAGRRMPAPDAAGGVGLWTVNQLCDLVEVRSSVAGTTVRVHTSLG
jgi:anti-sigma regulatory factor (Ser/Thr protein kinase)